jgi:hypothetical protein
MSPARVAALRNHRHDRYYVRYEVSRVMTCVGDVKHGRSQPGDLSGQ